MSTLEERIRQLMEGKETITTKNGNVITTDEDDKDEDKEDDKSDDTKDQDVDTDDQDGDKDEDKEDDDETTDFSKQNPKKVNEEASNEMLKKGQGQGDKSMGTKLAAPPSGSGGKDPKNSKLTVGQSRKDGEGVKGQSASQNDDNKVNAVDDQSLPTKPFKITVGESMNALFQGEELSEEFQSKAATIFESAVNQIVEQKMVELEEQYQLKLEEETTRIEASLSEAVEEVQNDLIENIDGFLNYAVEQWVGDNQIALESGIKVEMVTNFIDGLKTLFKENYVEVPEDKLDVVEEQANRIAELEEAILVINGDHDRLCEENDNLKKQAVVESVAKGMTLMQKDKFVSLCEGLEYSSDEEFEQKVKTIKESYFKDGKEAATQDLKPTTYTEVITEEVEDNISKYVQALGGPLKFSK
jgi:hypothetical protein